MHSLVTPNPPSRDVFIHQMGVYSVQMREKVTAAFWHMKTLQLQSWERLVVKT